MPIYEYTCKSCKAAFEQLVKSMSGQEKVKCPKCGSAKTERALSVFAVRAESGSKSAGGGHGPGCGCCGAAGTGACPMEQ